MDFYPENGMACGTRTHISPYQSITISASAPEYDTHAPCSALQLQARAWTSTMTMESVLLAIRTNMIIGGAH